MPTISMFYGILIRMFFKDTDRHNLPHIHAEYQGEVAVYSIPDGNLLAGTNTFQKGKAGYCLDRNSSRGFTRRLGTCC